MTEQFEAWLLDAQTRAKQKAAIFTDKEIEKLKLDYPEKLLAVVPPFLVTDDDIEQFKIHADALIAALPETTDVFKANLNTYTALITESWMVYSKKYNLVKKGTVSGQWLAICMAIGTGLGIILKKVGLGIPFGLLIGIMVGQHMEKKAVQEGRVL
ncbi:MAG: hypothetical protein V4619_15590 [Bacteroidota bacterium]